VDTRAYFPRARNIDLLGKRIQLHCKQLFSRKHRAAINLFVEQIMPGWLSLAKRNFFIPNQEWCRDETIDLLPRIDFVLCKTHFAYEVFQSRGFDVAYIGFSSVDRYLAWPSKNYDQFLHVAGRSRQKGTAALSRVWARHPEWPQLTIVSRNPDLVHGKGAKNIRMITDVLPHATLVTMQNQCGVHLCPSEAEGYGHHIAEALSCGAVVITTDAPPMNELVTSERGLLVPYSGMRPQSLGVNYYVDEAALEATIQTVLTFTVEEKKRLGDAGRTWFLDNQAEFECRLPNVINRCLSEIAA
jgi:glycosyltransferase involved in cell wall biosynthesis